MKHMCGRYVMARATGDLLSYFEAKEVEGSPPPPSWNVAPHPGRTDYCGEAG